MTVLQRIRKRWQAIGDHVGGLSNARMVSILLCAFGAWIIVDNHLLHLSSGLSRSSYDLMVQHRLSAAKPDPRIVIVDIDESSLARMSAEFGRWPWSRDALASVLDHIESQQPAAVVWDILFSDPDRASPGGDAAFDTAAAHSRHSHFSVVRLPGANDPASQITARVLPGLWIKSGTTPASTVALVPPFMQAVAASALGLTNAQPDVDGVIRRFRDAETLADGSILQTIPLSLLRALQPADVQSRIAAATRPSSQLGELVAWRRPEDGYPHVSFTDVFSAAEHQPSAMPGHNFAGKIVLIGATAPALHDVHATAVSATLSGVDTLATLIDNELNRRHVVELPRWGQTVIALLLCVGIAATVRLRGLSSLDPMIVALPAILIGTSYVSMHTDAVFLDLYPATGWALAFLAILKAWTHLRQAYWFSFSRSDDHALGLLPLRHTAGWSEGMRNALMNLLEDAGPACRIVVPAASNSHWPEFVQLLGLVGPVDELQATSARLSAAPAFAGLKIGQCRVLTNGPERTGVVLQALDGWNKLMDLTAHAEETA